VAEQENADGFSSYAGHKFAFHGFLGHQAHRTASAAFRRTAADHGNQPLFLIVIQHFRRPGRCLSYSARSKPPFFIPSANFPNGLRGQRESASDSRSAYPLGQLQQRQGTQHDSNLLYSTTQQTLEHLLLLDGYFGTQGSTSHAPSMRQNNST
jgi:hypothetical protein